MARGPQSIPVWIPKEQRPELERLAHRTKAGHVLVTRARIIVFSAKGMGTADVAKRAGCDERTARKWKARFRADPRVQTLDDSPRSGRPAQVPLLVRVELIKLACKRPDDKLAPFHEVWTHKALAEALEVVTGWRLSVSEVGRILRFHQLRPHHVRMWLYSGDLNFREKADRICQLYLYPAEGSHVICVDEKPMQALERKHPTETGPDGTVRYEYEYIRNGTCCLLGAFNTRTGQVFGRVVPERTVEERQSAESENQEEGGLKGEHKGRWQSIPQRATTLRTYRVTSTSRVMSTCECVSMAINSSSSPAATTIRSNTLVFVGLPSTIGLSRWQRTQVGGSTPVYAVSSTSSGRCSSRISAGS